MDINQFRADYLFNKYFSPFGQTKDQLTKTAHPSPFLSIPFILSIAFIILALVLFRLVIRIRKSFKEPSILLELTPPASTEKTAYTTQQLFSVIHSLGKQRSFVSKLLGKKHRFSFEIASTQHEGIRYLIRTTPEQVSNLKRSILSYLPHVNVKTADEYLPAEHNGYHSKIVEFKTTKYFAFPLQKQETLEEHDPVAYITGMMTKLSAGELISFQIVLTPTKSNKAALIKQKILRGDDILAYLNEQSSSPLKNTLKIPFLVIRGVFGVFGWAVSTIANDMADSKMAARQAQNRYMALGYMQGLPKPAKILNSFEQNVVSSILQKVEQPLFETSIRLLVLVKDKNDLHERTNGFVSSLGIFSMPEYQSLAKKFLIPIKILDKYSLLHFRKRLIGLLTNKSSMLFSVSEISDLYHFPFTRVTQTEDIVKIHSKELPAPLSLKQNRKLSVVFGKNTYAGSSTPIGLTEEERKTHMYIIGRTGSGKTTMLFSMAKHDIENNEGLAFIDPHGDVSEDLLACIPEERKDDLIYLNPFDLKHPVGINLLELTPGLDEDEAELEKEVVAEGVVSLFRKVFSKDENANAHRIEYILRNTVHTAFTTDNPTIFTLYDLLNNPPFQQQVVSKLQDENLKNFWKFEFGRAGDYQVVKMVGGVTAKIGRFLFSPTAKRILEQKKSTINFSEILNGKILICNLSQGKLGEDTARLLGTTILTKIQQAALKRADIPQEKRRQFHLYVDEFQNFATLSFAKMLSEGRKYGLEVYIAEQSTSQQQDRSIVNIILSNVTTILCFRSGNPIDEQLLLGQFAPYVVQGEIQYLPRYRFYIKISAIESEEPFSGETIFIPVVKDPEKRERLMERSRKNWAIVYQKPEKDAGKIVVVEEIKEASKSIPESINSNGLPPKNKP